MAVTALYLRYLLTPFLGESNPYLTVWLAVVFSSWYCGLGPSILATLLCILGTDYFFLPPFYSFLIEARSELYGILCFLIFAAAIIVLGESNRRAALLRRHAEARLKAAKDHLEQRVRERTAQLQERSEVLAKQTEMVRDLSARLLRLRDEERRRLARELHDSVGQLLAALSMNLAKVQNEKTKLSRPAAKSVDENAGLLRQTLSEIRTMSHLLHPPLLDEMGLETAIRWFIKGPSERSNIDVALTVAPGFDRLAEDLELAIFRILQECLTNIHRHSESKTARIRLDNQDGWVHCEISDDGIGIPPEKQLALNSPGNVGVGLRGMRERISQLNGVLQIQSDGRGTTVTVALPATASSLACQPSMKAE